MNRKNREVFLVFQLVMTRFPLDPKIILIAEKLFSEDSFNFTWNYAATFVGLVNSNRTDQKPLKISKLKYKNLETLKSAVWSLRLLDSCVLKSQTQHLSALLEMVMENQIESQILEIIRKNFIDPAVLSKFIDENYEISNQSLLLSRETIIKYKSTVSTIPKEALAIPGLSGITFLKSSLDFIPSVLLLFRYQLSHLNLSGTSLTFLPDFISNFKVLTNLGLEDTLLDSIPQLPSSLVSLSLAGAKRLATFPAEIAHLPNLVVLDLSGCSLRTIPDWLGQENVMKAPIQTLKLSGNLIESLGSGLGRLKTLKNIYASHNKLTVLPDLSELSLTLLDVGNNNLTQIAKPLSKPDSLRVLSLASNNFSLIPSAVLTQTSLTYLNVSHNRLISLSPQIGILTKLVYFDLTNNKLKRIPKTLMSMQELVEINMTGNRLLEAPSLDGIPTLMNVYFDIPAK